MKCELYWKKIDELFTKVIELSEEWLIPLEIEEFDDLHKLGKNRVIVEKKFALLDIAAERTAEYHDISKRDVENDVWLFILQRLHENGSSDYDSLPQSV